MTKPTTTNPPSEDWREVHASWQGGSTFNGLSSKGNLIPMGAVLDGGTSPMELVLIGLAGCTGMDIVSILKKKQKHVDKFELTVRGLRRFENPRIYTNIQVIYDLWSDDLDRVSVERAIQLSEEKYCSVSGMLCGAAEITSSYTIHASSAKNESSPVVGKTTER